MTTQPEALRLADVIEGSPTDEGIAKAAAELRRLYDENERLRTIIPGKVEELNDQLCDENDRLHEVNAELVEALRSLLPGAEAMGWNRRQALAAIAKATGENNE